MLNVLLVASESVPFVKTGGLADVVNALAKTLNSEGVCAHVMIPKHAQIKAEYQDDLETIATTTIHLGWREKYLGVQTMEKDGVIYYFIDNEDYFGGPVYRGGDAESEQYLYFCKAVCESLSLIDFVPDIIHLNDWHTGMIPLLLKTQYSKQLSKEVRTLFSIHNIQFQGKMDFSLMKDMLGIPDWMNTPAYVEAGGCANMLKSALVFADKISTVSPNYAEEIMLPYFGLGMEGVLNARRNDVCGILNGIDTEFYDAENDPSIETPFSVKDFTGKRSCKRALRDEFSLDIKLQTPIVAMISRMTTQKGFDLVRYSLEELLTKDMAFVLLGSGDQEYEDFFNYIAAKYPGKSGIWIGYNEELAHRIFAGADLFLMPSQFEPCGLTQMIAQRYGTLPIVRETGGLVDTVESYNAYTGEGNGFSFSTFNAHDMMNAINLALETYKNKPVLRKLRKNAMLLDNSFHKSAAQYKALYKSML